MVSCRWTPVSGRKVTTQLRYQVLFGNPERLISIGSQLRIHCGELRPSRPYSVVVHTAAIDCRSVSVTVRNFP